MKELPNHEGRVEIIKAAIAEPGLRPDGTPNSRPAFTSGDIIHTFVGGSDLHGASVGSDDLDVFGVFIENPLFTLGIASTEAEKWNTFDWSTSDNSRKNTKDDVDIVLHSLRKWARLAANGNPTIIHFLFTPSTTGLWESVRTARQLFLAKSHAAAFLGYAEAQMLRLNGRRAMNTNRPELILKYGYDTKMAMHMIRLMFEVEELLMDGGITFPNPRKAELIDIRQGKYTLAQINDWYEQLVASCKYWEVKSSLPSEINRHYISKLLESLYASHWHDTYWKR